jgi:hypothetical protein
MGCERTYDPVRNCPSGYNAYHNSCCSYGLYVFWNVLLWTSFFICCTLCIIAVALRQRRMREQRMALYQNQEQAFINNQFGAP